LAGLQGCLRAFMACYEAATSVGTHDRGEPHAGLGRGRPQACSTGAAPSSSASVSASSSRGASPARLSSRRARRSVAGAAASSCSHTCRADAPPAGPAIPCRPAEQAADRAHVGHGPMSLTASTALPWGPARASPALCRTQSRALGRLHEGSRARRRCMHMCAATPPHAGAAARRRRTCSASKPSMSSSCAGSSAGAAPAAVAYACSACAPAQRPRISDPLPVASGAARSTPAGLCALRPPQPAVRPAAPRAPQVPRPSGRQAAEPPLAVPAVPARRRAVGKSGSGNLCGNG